MDTDTPLERITDKILSKSSGSDTFANSSIIKWQCTGYIHGEPTQAVATLVFDSDIPQSAVSVNAVSTSYELLSDEDLEEIFNI